MPFMRLTALLAVVPFILALPQRPGRSRSSRTTLLPSQSTPPNVTMGTEISVDIYSTGAEAGVWGGPTGEQPDQGPYATVTNN